MTDEQMKEWCKEKKLDDLMNLLVKYGRMYEHNTFLGGDYDPEKLDRAIYFVKEEITNRVMGLN